MQNIKIFTPIKNCFFNLQQNNRSNTSNPSKKMLVHFISLALITTIGLGAMSCQTKSKSFSTFEKSLWIDDAANCNHYRSSVIENMRDEFDLFYGMDENEIISHLGNFTEKHLYTRGQKFAVFVIDCGNTNQSTRKLRFRYSALGYVNEVLILE
jgi:hypothetical protein